MTAVLVVRPSSLGDIVHALSLVADIDAALPGTTIDWVAEEAFVELPALSPRVSRVIPFALRRWRRSPLSRASWRELLAFRGEIRKLRYDVVLDLQEQVKGALVACSARGTAHGFDRASIREPLASWLDDVHHAVPKTLHFAERCRQLAAHALGYALAGPPRWTLVPPSHVEAMPSSAYCVALHGTSREGKLWPEAHWAALLRTLADAGLAPVLPWGSDAERARSERLAAAVGGAIVPRKQPLAALAAILANAGCVVGVDTGLTHLAAALRAPTLALFTETDPSRAGVAIAGPHAIDVGGNGNVPSVDEARAAIARVVQPRAAC